MVTQPNRPRPRGMGRLGGGLLGRGPPVRRDNIRIISKRTNRMGKLRQWAFRSSISIMSDFPPYIETFVRNLGMYLLSRITAGRPNAIESEGETTDGVGYRPSVG